MTAFAKELVDPPPCLNFKHIG